MATAVVWKGFVEQGAVPASSFELAQRPLPALKDGEALATICYISVDPYMRGRMRNTSGYFVPPFQAGEPVSSGCVVQVVESKIEGVSKGAYFSGMVGWQSPMVVTQEQVAGMTPVDTEVLRKARLPLSGYLGVMGLTGLTAYASLVKLGLDKLKPGATVYVSGAAGAVGSIVGQMCKHVYGCRVVGSAGSDEKVKFLTQELGFDAAYNYKTTAHAAALKAHCPDGIDLYYDNVGGETLEAALDCMNKFGVVIACGAISQYDSLPENRYGVRNLANVVFKSLRISGFILFDFMPDIVPEFFANMPNWVAEGKVKDREHVTPGGLAKAGQAFVDMMAGKNIGKAVVKCLDKDPITEA